MLKLLKKDMMPVKLLPQRSGGGYSAVMAPAQDFSGESAASNDPPNPVQSGKPLPYIGHTQVVVFLQATGSLGLD